ncbi:hypothetical protein M8818_007089 [Zalaria obscura]|uniref:Uncharacterized protein n=1 Tax=Zalaria obscura TaxID=2024903 RepID=A0ACC3S406_9PEZI
MSRPQKIGNQPITSHFHKAAKDQLEEIQQLLEQSEARVRELEEENRTLKQQPQQEELQQPAPSSSHQAEPAEELRIAYERISSLERETKRLGKQPAMLPSAHDQQTWEDPAVEASAAAATPARDPAVVMLENRMQAVEERLAQSGAHPFTPASELHMRGAADADVLMGDTDLQGMASSNLGAFSRGITEEELTNVIERRAAELHATWTVADRNHRRQLGNKIAMHAGTIRNLREQLERESSVNFQLSTQQFDAHAEIVRLRIMLVYLCCVSRRLCQLVARKREESISQIATLGRLFAEGRQENDALDPMRQYHD